MALPYPMPRHFTPEEYLTLERDAPTKSEYLCGDIYAMAGGTPEHNILSANVIGELHARLRGRPCRVYTSDQRVRTTPEGLFAYPDVTVGCGKPIYHDDKGDVLTNPIVLVEVLFESTAAYDRTTKFQHYQSIASLTDYILIAQNEPRIEHYARQSDHAWLLTITTGLESRITLSSLDITLPLTEIYANILA